ncbi:uncharacterized protein FTOL_08327 [Fusarium torulosum]|uniref:Protein kinase domain-containing protein n=1 Tax=Fusarium torulosum TaxID=33205 RepID=A0AAE8MF34_9HYPO|nr:uncharacterized protein FTOL_08327 [Fusarium torulosum]
MASLSAYVSQGLPAHDERHEDFIEFVTRNSQMGLDGLDRKAPFISPAETEAWWRQRGENRIPRALDRSIQARPSTILTGYITIFSILVYIRRTCLIPLFIRHGFQDTQLPILDPACFGDDPTQIGMMCEFCDSQWRFCPVVFSNSSPMDQRNIDTRQILPIRSEKMIGSKARNSKSLIRVITLHDGCYETSWSPTGVVVFKEYRKEVFRRSWTREFNAFVSIDSCEHIVQYLGSFEQSNRCFIILEYASGGSLLHLFNQDVRPTTPEQRMHFWRGLMGLTKAINKIQNLGGGPHDQRTGFAHRDINPANILVFPGEDGMFSPGFKMKLADFDTAIPIHHIGDESFTNQDNDGNRTYCAPEASRIYEEEERDLKQVHVASDIWSLGCVVSESIIWVSGGMAALERAVIDRTTEIKKVQPTMVGSGFEQGFHNCTMLLNCVYNAHRTALENLQGISSLSKGICNLAELGMLVSIEDRNEPMVLWNQFDRLYNQLSAGIIQSPITDQFATDTTYCDKLVEDPALYGNLPASGPSSSTYLPVNIKEYRNLVPKRTPRTPAIQADLALHNWGQNHQSHPAAERPTSKYRAPQNPYHSSASQHQGTGAHFKENRYSQQNSSILQDGNGGHSAIPHRYSATPTIGQNGFHSLVSAQVTPLERPASGFLSPLHTPTKTTSMYGTTTVDDAFRHRQNNGRRETLDGYLNFRRRMTPRHFIILIDDSESMRIMFREVLKVVEVLVWLVKDIDSLGVDVRFLSNPTKKHTRTFPRPSTDKLMAPVRQWFNKSDAEKYCNMKYLLNKIFADDKIVNPKHPTSVLVLTDGVWEGGPIQDSGVEKSISQVIRQMDEKGVRDTDFTFQFVRFGNNPDGLARLKYLDDEAVFDSSKRHKIDIVDSKTSAANVWAILTGAVSEINDKDDEM